MSCNGVYGLFGNGFGGNPYLPMAGYLTSTLGSCPANIWSARNWTQAAQSWTHMAAYPYGFNFNFTGRRNQYVVADAFTMPYQTALGLQTGQIFGAGMNAQQLGSYFSERNKRFVVDLSATKTASDLQRAHSIGQCKDEDYMKAEENKALRDEVVAMEKKAEELLKQFEEAMKDADSLSTSELDAKIKVYSEKAKSLIGQSDELYKRIQEAEKAYADKIVKDAEEKAKKDVEETGSGDDAGAAADAAGSADETKRQEGKPPEVKTSAKKSEVTEKGTKLEKGVKGKADGQRRTGTFYEYEGRIYQILASKPEPKDVTDEVEKITT